jgi:hypothetical protein
MYNADNYIQYLKLLLPSNELITIQICTDEIEFKDLLTTLTNINSSNIKGFKDSNGNYFTFSSIKNSYNPNEIYTLIIDNNNNNNNDIININTINSININNNEYNIINNNINNLPYNQVHNNINNKQFYRTFSYDKNNNILYKNYLIQIYNNFIISKNEFNIYLKMINHNNKEIINKFELFFHGKISEKEFLIYLKQFNVNNLDKDFLDAVYKKLSNYFNEDENEIIRQMIKYENENLKQNILNYKLNKDFNKLFEETKKCLERFNERKNNKIFANLRQSIEFNKYVRHNSSPQVKGTNKNKPNKKKENSNKKINNLNQNKPVKIKKKSNNLSTVKRSDIENYIKKYNLKIFQYIYNNINEEKYKIKKIYSNNEDKKDKKKHLNYIIQDYIISELITYSNKLNNNNNLLSIDVNLFKKLLKEKNVDLINIYENFNNNFEMFLNDIITVLNKYKKSNIDNNDNNNNINNINNNNFNNIEEVVNYFTKKNTFTNEQMTYLMNNCDTNQKIIMYFNDYLNNKDKKNLLTSIEKYIKKKIKKNKEFTFGIKQNTKSSITISKNIIEDDNNENKQKKILKILLTENLIDKNTYNIILKKFDINDINVISAFNVYGYTKNHDDFIETLEILSEIHETNCEDTFNFILNNCKFSNIQKKKLADLFNKNNKELINILKSYEDSNLNTIIEKLINIVSNK